MTPMLGMKQPWNVLPITRSAWTPGEKSSCLGFGDVFKESRECVWVGASANYCIPSMGLPRTRCFPHGNFGSSLLWGFDYWKLSLLRACGLLVWSHFLGKSRWSSCFAVIQKEKERERDQENILTGGGPGTWTGTSRAQGGQPPRISFPTGNSYLLAWPDG